MRPWVEAITALCQTQLISLSQFAAAEVGNLFDRLPPITLRIKPQKRFSQIYQVGGFILHKGIND
jgi:hypothetical protein